MQGIPDVWDHAEVKPNYWLGHSEILSFHERATNEDPPEVQIFSNSCPISPCVSSGYSSTMLKPSFHAFDAQNQVLSTWPSDSSCPPKIGYLQNFTKRSTDAAQIFQVLNFSCSGCKYYMENPPSRDWDGVWDQVPLGFPMEGLWPCQSLVVMM